MVHSAPLAMPLFSPCVFLFSLFTFPMLDFLFIIVYRFFFIDNFRWLYCLTIMGCNFVFNDLLHQTLISNNGPWFTFPFMHI